MNDSKKLEGVRLDEKAPEEADLVDGTVRSV
jgi:hypothetical protein